MQEAKHMSVTISSKILEIEPGFLELTELWEFWVGALLFVGAWAWRPNADSSYPESPN